MAYSLIATYEDNTVQLRVSGTSKGDTVRFYLRTEDNEALYDETKTATGYYTRSDLIYNNLDLHTWYVANAAVNGDWLGAIDVYLYEAPDVEIVSYTSTTLKVKVTNIDKEADVLNFQCSDNETDDEYTITSSMTSKTYTYKNIDITEEQEFYISVSDADYDYMMTRIIIWSPGTKVYTITFDKNGGTGGTDSITIQKTKQLPDIEIPIKTGYTFAGYYDEDEVQYFDAEGSGCGTYDLDEDITLYAKWEVALPAIDLWYWTLSNGDATISQTQKAYSAITSKGKVSDFNYLVWNDMCNKVKVYLDEAGKSWNSYYDYLNNTKMTSSDKVLTAKRFNSLRYNIGVHISTGINEVQKGDKVMGSYFITLMDKLNQLIINL